jgi:HPt (histidine-containing phosphotransfer) domain-containing protein
MSSDTHTALAGELALLPLVDEETLDGLKAVLEDELFPILDEFAATLPQQLEGVQAAFAGPDWPFLQREIHSIKGSAGNVGAARLSRYAATMERLSFQESLDPVMALFPGLHALSAETLEALSAFTASRR